MNAGGLARLRAAQKKHFKEGSSNNTEYISLKDLTRSYTGIPFCITANAEKGRPKGMFPYCLHQIPVGITEDSPYYEIVCQRGRKEDKGQCAVCNFNDYMFQSDESPFANYEEDSFQAGDFDDVQRCITKSLACYNMTAVVPLIILGGVDRRWVDKQGSEIDKDSPPYSKLTKEALKEKGIYEEKFVFPYDPDTEADKFSLVVLQLRPWNGYFNSIDQRDAEFIRFILDSYKQFKGRSFSIWENEDQGYLSTQWYSMETSGKKTICLPYEGSEEWEFTGEMQNALQKRCPDVGSWRAKVKEGKAAAVISYKDQIHVMNKCLYVQRLGGFPPHLKNGGPTSADPVRDALDYLVAINQKD